MKREEALFRLGDLLAHSDESRASEAEDLFREAQRIAPDYAGSWAGAAYAAQVADHIDDAIGLYDKAMKLDPNDPVICFHLGQCLARRASAAPSTEAKPGPPPDLVRAEDMFGQSIRLRHDFGEAYVEYARLIYEMGVADKAAIPLFEAARVLLPSRVDVVANLAILYARTGQAARAQDVVEKVLARMNDPESLAFARTQVKLETERLAARTSPAAQPKGSATDRTATNTTDVPSDEPPAGTATLPPIKPLTRLPENPILVHNQQIAAYNEAVAHANRRDYKGAMEILEKLWSQVQDKDLLTQIQAFMAQLKKDAPRFQKQPG